MKCKSCGEDRILRDGICFFCIRAKKGVPGKEISAEKFDRKGGTEIQSKTGYIDENLYLRT